MDGTVAPRIITGCTAVSSSRRVKVKCISLNIDWMDGWMERLFSLQHDFYVVFHRLNRFFFKKKILKNPTPLSSVNSYCVLCRVNQAPSPRSKPRHEAGSGRSSQASSPSPQYKLHSFSLLNYDRERLERKVLPVTWFHSPSHFSIAHRLLHLSLSSLSDCRLQEDATGSPVRPAAAAQRGGPQVAVAEGAAGARPSCSALR